MTTTSLRFLNLQADSSKIKEDPTNRWTSIPMLKLSIPWFRMKQFRIPSSSYQSWTNLLNALTLKSRRWSSRFRLWRSRSRKLILAWIELPTTFIQSASMMEMHWVDITMLSSMTDSTTSGESSTISELQSNLTRTYLRKRMEATVIWQLTGLFTSTKDKLIKYQS